MIITELLGLGKSSENMESNCSHSTAKATANPCPSPCATSTHLLNPSRDGDSTTGLGSLCQSWTTLPLKKLLPSARPKPPLKQLETVSSHASPCSMGAEPNPHLAGLSCQGVAQSKTPLEASFSPDRVPPGISAIPYQRYSRPFPSSTTLHWTCKEGHTHGIRTKKTWGKGNIGK